MDFFIVPIDVCLPDGFLPHGQQNHYPVKQEFGPQTNKTIIFWSPGFAKGIRLDEGEVCNIKQVAVLKSDTCCIFFLCFFTTEGHK